MIDRRAALEAQASVRELQAENAQLKARLEALEKAAKDTTGLSRSV